VGLPPLIGVAVGRVGVVFTRLTQIIPKNQTSQEPPVSGLFIPVLLIYFPLVL